MKTIEIKGTARVAGGKKAAKQLRKQGIVPCNLYGEKKGENGLPEATAFSVTEGELRKLLYTPDIYTVKLDTDEKPIVMEVPIKLNGLATGVKAGGKLSASVRKLKVKAVHTAIPERLDIDVTNLELGKTIKVGELSFEGLELVTSPSVVVCQVKMTRNARSAASAEEAAEA